jgi:ethanolamine ammonia-lyase small subunit
MATSGLKATGDKSGRLAGGRVRQPRGAATLLEVDEIAPGRRQANAYSTARLSLGRSAAFVSTRDHLAFQLDHARARDAVHDAADFHAISAALSERGTPPLLLESAIPSGPESRQSYLRRPDLGRQLSAASAERLREYAAVEREKPQAAIIIADGLSALAVDRHAVPLVDALTPRLAGWRQAPITLVRNARVAIGDEIGEILGAELTILLIGERPGLTAPDSLGVYLTWNPRTGRTDADRNCISNIRLEGTGYDEAAERICFYANAARSLGGSGFALKEGQAAISPALPRPAG